LKPYISFVTALNRVDTHGDLMDRFRTSLRTTVALAQGYKLDFEIIVVDWNSPTEFPFRLAHDYPFVLITITKDQHEALPNPHGQLFFEWHAKNVGIRASAGEFVLCHNADDIFSPELMRRMSLKLFREDQFYRVNRYDIKALGEPWFKVQTPAGEFKRGEDMTISQTGVPYSHDMLAFRASGDFMLMSRTNWFRLRGYPETRYDGSVDGQMIHIAHKHGLRQVLLPEPLYHIDHPRGGRRMYTPPWSDAEPFGEMNGEKWGMV
jgi:hypothetical protein